MAEIDTLQQRIDQSVRIMRKYQTGPLLAARQPSRASGGISGVIGEMRRVSGGLLLLPLILFGVVGLTTLTVTRVRSD